MSAACGLLTQLSREKKEKRNIYNKLLDMFNRENLSFTLSPNLIKSCDNEPERDVILRKLWYLPNYGFWLRR